STLDLRDLRLDRDRTIHLDHFAGVLEVGLPTHTTTRVEADVSVGDILVHRPRVGSAFGDPERSSRWIRDGLPEEGAPLTDEDAPDRWWQHLPASASQEHRLRTPSQRLVRTFDQGSAHVLRIVIRMGVGEVELYDPH